MSLKQLKNGEKYYLFVLADLLMFFQNNQLNHWRRRRVIDW